jgi:hypothetical protein
MITVIGIFEKPELAEEACSYLMANGFTDEKVDLHTTSGDDADKNRVGDFFGHLFNEVDEAAHYATLAQNGTIVTIHALSAREGQEALDVMNNYGAVEVKASDDSPVSNGAQSRMVERVIDDSKRLRGNKIL